MRRIVTNDRYPFMVLEITFQLNHKHDHFTMFQFKTNAQGIFIVQQAAKFNGSHITIVQ